MATPLNVSSASSQDDADKDPRHRLLDSESDKRSRKIPSDAFVSHVEKYRKFVVVILAVLFLFVLFSVTVTWDSRWGPNMVRLNATTQEDEYGNTWKESTVEVNNITVYYYHNEQQSSMPVVFYFHGGGMDGTEGITIFGPIAKDFRMFFPTARGFGKTTAAPPFGTAQAVLDAEALIPKLVNVEQEKVYLAAHSMGATIAPRVAKNHPQYVAKLVLEDPGWLRREGEDPSHNPPGTQPRGGDDLSNESVENITVPALILTAENGDAVPAVIDVALETYTHGSKHYFPGADHCIHCGFPAEYLKVVSEFFAS